MAVVLDPTFGPKPSMTLLGGSPSSLAAPSVPFMPQGRSITLVGGQLRTVSFYNIYESQPRIATAIRRMAEAIARLPLQVFEYLDDAGDTRQRDRKHGAARVLSRPRPRQRGFHLRWDLALSIYVHGNYVAWKRRATRGGPPVELWTLDWRLLVPKMIGGRVFGWEWLGDGIPGLQRGDTILVEDTVHVAFGAPGGGEIGISPLQQLGVTIRSEDAIQRLSEANFRNGTRFGVAAILDPQAKADKVIRDGVREELIDAHGGVDQAFRPVILGGGVTDLKPLGTQTAVEAELVRQRELNTEEACGLIGLPLPLAGVLDDANYSALKELHRILYVTNLGGPLALIGESLQAQLFDAEPVWDRDDRFVEFSLDEVLKGDAGERWKTYDLAVGMGGLTLNDVRRKENLPPYADPRANEPLIKANNVRPLSAVGAAGTNVIEGNPAALKALLELTREHTARALERTAVGVAAGMASLDALDADLLEAELLEDLEAAGFNGSSQTIAAVVAADLVARLSDADSPDAVRAHADPLETA